MSGEAKRKLVVTEDGCSISGVQPAPGEYEVTLTPVKPEVEWRRLVDTATDLHPGNWVEGRAIEVHPNAWTAVISGHRVYVLKLGGKYTAVGEAQSVGYWIDNSGEDCDTLDKAQEAAVEYWWQQ